MQHRYVGDIGDYIKFALLRAIIPGHRLGVAWWLYPDEGHNGDGRHVSYLSKPAEWRAYEPTVFDALAGIVRDGRRHVGALEGSGMVAGAVFHGEVYPTVGTPKGRAGERTQWFERALVAMEGCDLVFADPDNGLEPAGFNTRTASAGKSIALEEVRLLCAPGRCVIVYHHQSRRAGGHLAEIAHWSERLRRAGLGPVVAVRAQPFSPRVYFFLNAPGDVLANTQRVIEQWRGRLTWHP